MSDQIPENFELWSNHSGWFALMTIFTPLQHLLREPNLLMIVTLVGLMLRGLALPLQLFKQLLIGGAVIVPHLFFLHFSGVRKHATSVRLNRSLPSRNRTTLQTPPRRADRYVSRSIEREQPGIFVVKGRKTIPVCDPADRLIVPAVAVEHLIVSRDSRAFVRPRKPRRAGTAVHRFGMDPMSPARSDPIQTVEARWGGWRQRCSPD
jgi:hypothetical protein